MNEKTLTKLTNTCIFLPNFQDHSGVSMRYHAKFTNFSFPPELPVYVEFVSKGRHPENHIHDHNFTEVVLILSGEGLYRLEEEERMIEAGDLLVIPPGVTHGYDRTKTLELVNLTYRTEDLYLPLLDAYELPLFELFFPAGNTRREAQVFLDPVLHLSPGELADTTEKIRLLQKILRSKHPGHCFKALGIFIEIISFLAGKENSHLASTLDFPGCGNILRLMRQNLKHNFSTAELAEHIHTSERTLLRRFKAATGSTPTEYLTNLRLQHAEKLLYATELSISEIALECGFYDGSHFSRLFSACHNISPRLYRQRKRRLQN